MKNFFSNSTGIPDYENMKVDKKYWNNNKNLEIFTIKIKPQDYLRKVEKSFLVKNGTYSFTPSPSSIENINKAIDEGIKIDIPFLYEKYMDNWEHTEKYYSVGHEGRHRRTVRMEKGLDYIEVAYIKNLDKPSKIGMEKYILKIIIKEFKENLIDKPNLESYQELSKKLTINNIDNTISKNNKEWIILIKDKDIIKVDLNEKKDLIFDKKENIDTFNKSLIEFDNLNYKSDNRILKNINKLFEGVITKSINNIIDFDLETKIYLNGWLGSYKKNSLLDEAEPKIYINEEILRYEKDFVNVDTLLHEYGHLLYEMSLDYRQEEIRDFYAEKLNEIEFMEFIKNNYDENVDPHNIQDDDIEYYSEAEDSYYYELFLEEKFRENFKTYIRIKENNIDYLKNINEEYSYLEESEIKFFDKIVKKLNNFTLVTVEDYQGDLKLRKNKEKNKEYNLDLNI